MTQEPLRILHLNAGNLYGGVESMLITFARANAEGTNVHSTFGLGWEGRLMRELEEAKAFCHLLQPASFSRPWTIFRARRRLARLLDQSPRPDLVLCHMPWSWAVWGPRLRQLGCRTAVWIHNPPGDGFVDWMAVHWEPDHLIFNSAWTRDQPTSMALWPKVSRTVIHPPLTPLLPSMEPGQDSSPIRLLQMSRLEPWKGHALLLRALTRLPAEPAWECHIAGRAQRKAEQRYLDYLKGRVDELGLQDRVHFIGEVTDAAAALAKADIYVQPNFEPEPFGLVFAEAMQAGLPVVTLGEGGITELATSACAAFIDRNDEDGLLEALQTLIGHSEKRQAMGRRGAQLARELTAPDRACDLLKCLAKGVTS